MCLYCRNFNPTFELYFSGESKSLLDSQEGFSFLVHQNKDLKSRVSHLEGSQRTGQDSLVSKLNSRIQELEERLQEEER